MQSQTGIPYVLIDGTFAKSAETYRIAGAVLGETARGEEMAHYADDTLNILRQRIESIPQAQRPRV